MWTASCTGIFIVLQAIVLLIAAVVLILNLMIDLLYGVLDPGSTTSKVMPQGEKIMWTGRRRLEAPYPTCTSDCADS